MLKLVVPAVLLALAGLLVVAGVAMWSVPWGFVAGGVLLAVWSLLFTLDLPTRPADDDGGDDA